MKVLFCGYRNPNFRTITEYSESAFRSAGCEEIFFGDRSFIIPGRVRRLLPGLDTLELLRINRLLVRAAVAIQPDMMFACGGLRVLPFALKALEKMGVRRVLWTIDPPRAVASPADDFISLLKTAPLYDEVFCGGSEAVEALRGAGVARAELLPFACDPKTHLRRELSPEDSGRLGSDICFVGTINPSIYPGRVAMLESISDMDLKVWGPGAAVVPVGSPLRKHIMGEQTPPELWTGIYSASKIALCMHYSDPDPRYPCYQASPRVFEALACGAFLMCDAQRDVLSLFEDGKHLVIFRNKSELREKLTYYLAHPEKRAAIAAAGREEVLKKHTYRHRMEEVLKNCAKK